MNLLEKYQNDIRELCIKYNVNQLYAFGSVLTDGFKDSSDIDLIVNFDKIKIEDYANNYYNLKFSLEDIFKRPVDLLEYKALKNPYFNREIEKQRQLVYG
ncbi:nucleotidyltransferase family protein [Pedobacter foliorum]|uniref:nucleotidyltransferase family protein n=1 Tax=Pedobacter foliorum TaxID=2739058 RepID=UPI001564AE08|nr:nucleotidyltransferase domain-containing protein [Pedobacter foliorum]NRF37208.1 nucleotidyltransferase domain-containing protein [Pedobacter foliorum]